MTLRRTILIANAQPHLRHHVRRTIASDDYLVLETGDGDEAWELLQVCRPDVTILGAEMPGRDGLALTRAIRADPLFAHTRVILQLGSQGSAMLAQGHLAGVDRYLPNRCSPWQILVTLEACLRAAGVATPHQVWSAQATAASQSGKCPSFSTSASAAHLLT